MCGSPGLGPGRGQFAMVVSISRSNLRAHQPNGDLPQSCHPCGSKRLRKETFVWVQCPSELCTIGKQGNVPPQTLLDYWGGTALVKPCRGAAEGCLASLTANPQSVTAAG